MIFQKIVKSLETSTASSQRLYAIDIVKRKVTKQSVKTRKSLNKKKPFDMFLAVSSPSVDPSFFALSTMIRHSVNAFLGQLAQERPMRFELDKIYEATKFLNDFEFPKRLRIGYQTSKWPNF